MYQRIDVGQFRFLLGQPTTHIKLEKRKTYVKIWSLDGGLQIVAVPLIEARKVLWDRNFSNVNRRWIYTIRETLRAPWPMARINPISVLVDRAVSRPFSINSTLRCFDYLVRIPGTKQRRSQLWYISIFYFASTILTPNCENTTVHKSCAGWKPFTFSLIPLIKW